MTASEGVVGLGTRIEMASVLSPTNFALIPEATDIDGPEITQEYVDFTHQQSTGGFRERKPSFKSSGQVTFECALVYGDAQQDALIAAALDIPATLMPFRLVYPDTSEITFSAYPSVHFKAPMNNRLAFSVTLSLEGAFEYNPA
jgi:hypothetical protein